MLILKSRKLAIATLGLGLALGFGALDSGVAEAHFKLVAPDAYSKQDASIYGDPQKPPPCGLTDPVSPNQLTGLVTNYVAGQKITITIDEKIPHPGWYRVAIAKDAKSLPAEPKVTSVAGDDCDSTVIDATVPGVIADGLFKHTSAFTTPQTAEIQLPAGFTCQNCVLQVIEWMSSHPFNNPGGCFYHHCATVNITATAPDGGVTAPADMSTSPADLATDPGGGSQPSGCSYQMGAVPPSAVGMVAGLLTFGMLLRRRRRTAV